MPKWNDSADEAGWSPAETPRGVRSNHMHDHDTDDLDFAMLTPPTRPGPAKAATAPEMDPVERRVEREREAAEHIIAAVEAKTQRGPDAVINGRVIDYKYARAVEVRHGSGKVKV